MANKTGKKGKKPLQTTLGKAACQNEKEMDLSHIQKPIHTSVFGLRQVLSLFQTATEEVQNYITYECDIMYECRMCRTIFRSLANFILHKRNYCREKFKQIDLLNSSNIQETTCLGKEDTNCASGSVRSVTPEQKERQNSKEMKKSLSPIIDRLKEKQEIRQIAQEALSEDLSSQDTTSKSNTPATKKGEDNDLLLERIATNNAAVFQTILEKLPASVKGKSEFMKSEVMEIHGILDSDEAVLGPDGKICTFETNKVNENPIIPKSDLFCTECNLKFSTKKTLTYHIKYKHNNTRLVYVCPDCKDTFANAWCVYRHLYKIHRRTSAQIKRMRDQIHNSRIRKDQEPSKKKEKKNEKEKIDRTDEENQWLDNIEGDNDFQMCGGCGKRFERKAALNSHAQMCVKRIAVCNTIKENNAKKKEEVGKENKHKFVKTEKAAPSDVVRGSSKRKPYLLRTYKPNEEKGEDMKSESTEEVKDTCDVNANCEIVETNCDNALNKTEDKSDLTHKVRNSSSPSKDVQLPLSKSKDHCVSPSVDKIDTEKMLSIIGITSNSNYENVNKRDGASTSSNAKEVSPKEQTEEKSHTAKDFDLFFQSVAKTLVKEMPEEIENNFPKSSKTIPLILRRRHSVRTEKRNSILEQTSKEIPITENILNEEQEKTNDDILEYENIAQGNDSLEVESLPSTSSTYKISVKNLEDLIGVSTEDHIKHSETNANNEISEEAESMTKPIDDSNATNCAALSTSKELSDMLRANMSLEKLHDRPQKPIKRKRTSSFDYTRINKSSKLKARESFSNKQDVSFISKASLYMDTNKLLCVPCKLTYTTLSQLLWHMSAHFSWFRFQCSRCSFISFNKQDCANHARKNHHVKKSSIQSVVLPIPNWKTVLMAHDFSMLKDENDLSGKHTDEIISGSQESNVINEDIEEEKDEEHVSDWSGDLFVDSINLDSDPENYNPDCQLDCDNADNNIKQEGIDIINNDQELFQIEVPQEIYTLDVSEIIKDVAHEERHRLGSYTKIEKEEYDEELENVYRVSKVQENDPVVADIKVEAASDEDVNEKLFISRNEVPFDAEVDFKKIPNQIVNLRPTRNRTRSIKTLQDDFFYDLSKVIKLNDSSVNKPTSQKHKKANNCTSQKNSKDSVNSGTKSEARPLRVYSKKK